MNLSSISPFAIPPVGTASRAPVGGGVIIALVEVAWHQLGRFIAFFLSDFVAGYTQRNSALKAISKGNSSPCLAREKNKRHRHFLPQARNPVSRAIMPGTNRARAPPRQGRAGRKSLSRSVRIERAIF